MTWIELLLLFQSLGTIHVLPEVRKMIAVGMTAVTVAVLVHGVTPSVAVNVYVVVIVGCTLTVPLVLQETEPTPLLILQVSESLPCVEL